MTTYPIAIPHLPAPEREHDRQSAIPWIMTMALGSAWLGFSIAQWTPEFIGAIAAASVLVLGAIATATVTILNRLEPFLLSMRRVENKIDQNRAAITDAVEATNGNLDQRIKTVAAEVRTATLADPKSSTAFPTTPEELDALAKNAARNAIEEYENAKGKPTVLP